VNEKERERQGGRAEVYGESKHPTGAGFKSSVLVNEGRKRGKQGRWII